jgi:hypothetical protein
LVESAQISGKVFRFLSTMHPSLSKPERKRYSEFDPDKWYPWNADIAGEFTDLMKRSPRDTSFARGLAYAATKGLPEDARLSPTDIIAGLSTLPSAFVGPGGSGFEVQMNSPGEAEVYYRGMPGFSNVCIAIAGELTQRLQAVGARGLDVRHADGCRLQGSDACHFSLRWTAEAGEQSGQSAASAPVHRAASETALRVPRSRFEEPAPAPRAEISPRPAPPSGRDGAAPAAPRPTNHSSDDLFDQLRTRLAEAERQTSRHNELENHIAALDARASELESALAAAQADADSARRELADLKRRLRELVD